MLYFSVQWIAGIIFWFEVQIKWTGWGKKMYFKDYFNWLDVFLLGFWVLNTLMLVLVRAVRGQRPRGPQVVEGAGSRSSRSNR